MRKASSVKRTTLRRLALLFAAAAAAAVVAAAPSAALSFGTIQGYIFGNGPFNSEHEMITRAALSCAVPDKVPNCFEPRSLDNLAGKMGTFGAVGAPDNYSTLGGGPDYWHCDGADAFQNVRANYPVSPQDARAKLSDCRRYAYLEMNMGTRGTSYSSRGTTNGAVGGARFLLNTEGQVDVSDLSSRSCTFNLSSGRAKCNELESFGRALHAIQDFYSHSNWADQPEAGALSLANPPGLGQAEMAAAFWNMNEAGADVPEGGATGCYPTSKCQNRVTHDEGLNKGRVIIDWRSGLAVPISCTDVCTARGSANDNEARAVRDAIQDTRRQWADLQARIIQKEGDARGQRIICAISRDDINTVCNQSGVAAKVATTERGPGLPAAPRPASGASLSCRSLTVGPGALATRIRATGTTCAAARSLVRAVADAAGRAQELPVPGAAYSSVFVTGPLRGVRVTVDPEPTSSASKKVPVITLTRSGQRVTLNPACMSASRGGDANCGF